MDARLKFEAAKATHRALERALCVADGKGEPPHVIDELARKEREAFTARCEAFKVYMASDE